MNVFGEVSDRMSEEYLGISNDSAKAYNRYQASLTDILITAALAYLGIITIVIGSGDILDRMVLCQKIFLGVSVVFFLGSIIFGVVTHLRDMIIHRKFYITYGKFWNDVQMAASEDELGEIGFRADTFEMKYLEDKSGLVISLVQTTLFVLAAVVAVAFVLSFL